MKAYKGFNRDMTCRGFQYKAGATYTTDRAKVCDSGFHACENPIDCFGYYGPTKSVYHEVELDGAIDKNGDDTKVAATKIKIGAALSIPALCKATFEYVRSKCTNEHNAKAGKAATAGYSGAATAGNYGAATASYRGAATAGDSGAATSRGSVAVGENGVGTVRATDPKIKEGMGAMLTIAKESENDYDIVAWKSFVIDGKKYKPDTWYTLENGKVVEARDED
jgi:hypothetical protein